MIPLPPLSHEEMKFSEPGSCGLSLGLISHHLHIDHPSFPTSQARLGRPLSLQSPPPTFQFSCIFILTASFSYVREFSSGFCLWGSMHSQRYLAHLHDGIFRAASPILRDWGSLHCGWDEWEMSRCTPVCFLFRTTSPPNHKLAFIKMWHLSFQSEFISLWCE